MAIPLSRRALLLGATGALAACLGVTAITVAYATPQAAPRAVAAEALISAVEDFSYPNADKVAQERGITLKRGDGHLMLVQCTTAWDIKVESRLGNSYEQFCFKTDANTGYISMELPNTYGIRTSDHPVEATLTTEGTKTVVEVPKDNYKPVGEGDVPSGGQAAVLLELRVTG